MVFSQAAVIANFKRHSNMEIIYIIITVLSVISTILAWIAKIRWAKEYSQAKDETIKSKEAEISSVKEQLKTKDELIAMKESFIQQLTMLNPPKLKEYYDTVTSGLEAYNDKLKKELELRKDEFENTIEKLKKVEPENENNKMAIDSLNSEKLILQQKIEFLTKQIQSQSEKIAETKNLFPKGFTFQGAGLKRQRDLSDEQIVDFLKKLKTKTQFLWKGIIELTTNENSIKEEIKASTYSQIQDTLNFLQFAGQLDYKISEAYETITSKEKVYELTAWNISTQIKNFANRIENGDI